MIVYSGRATAYKPMGHGEEPKALNTMKRGDYFGEIALINQLKRTATVIAQNRLTVILPSEEGWVTFLIDKYLCVRSVCVVCGQFRL